MFDSRQQRRLSLGLLEVLDYSPYSSSSITSSSIGKETGKNCTHLLSNDPMLITSRRDETRLDGSLMAVSVRY